MYYLFALLYMDKNDIKENGQKSNIGKYTTFVTLSQ